MAILQFEMISIPLVRSLRALGRKSSAGHASFVLRNVTMATKMAADLRSFLTVFISRSKSIEEWPNHDLHLSKDASATRHDWCNSFFPHRAIWRLYFFLGRINHELNNVTFHDWIWLWRWGVIALFLWRECGGEIACSSAIWMRAKWPQCGTDEWH
jgi:hypothetical protein